VKLLILSDLHLEFGTFQVPDVDDWCSAAYASELPDEFFEVPTLWLHGHVHKCLDYRVGNCRVVCNPRGYKHSFADGAENAAFDPSYVIEV